MADARSESELLEEGLVMIEHQAKHPHLGKISDHIDELSAGLRDVSLKIHDHPELAYKETFAHDTITNFMSKQAGWIVTRSAYDIKTAFVAVYDSGKLPALSSMSPQFCTHPGVELEDRHQ